MYKYIDFSKTGGFPLTQDVMAFLQNSYNSVFGTISQTLGQYNILTGVTLQSGGTYTDGWVSIDGEILPFIGGASQSSITIVESAVTVTYRDTSMNAVIITRKAILSNTGVPITSFTRLSLDSLKDDADAALAAANTALTNANTALTNANTALTNANTALNRSFKTGMIIMWSGSQASIPSGFTLCNGSSGTPDLRGKFIAGAGSGGPYAPGNTGGANTVTLSVTEMPPHFHNTNIKANSQDYVDGGSSPNNIGNSGVGTQITTSSAGSGAAHENRPPYYALCYIMKT